MKVNVFRHDCAGSGTWNSAIVLRICDKGYRGHAWLSVHGEQRWTARVIRFRLVLGLLISGAFFWEHPFVGSVAVLYGPAANVWKVVLLPVLWYRSQSWGPNRSSCFWKKYSFIFWNGGKGGEKGSMLLEITTPWVEWVIPSYIRQQRWKPTMNIYGTNKVVLLLFKINKFFDFACPRNLKFKRTQ